MSQSPNYPTITKDELFARLAASAGEQFSAQVTVVTPNRRLAQSLVREFDTRQAAAGLASWETADILPLSAFVERTYEEALYSELAPKLPLLLTPAQEQLLWEEAIVASQWGDVLLALAPAAGDARKAWGLAHQWRIEGALGTFPGNEDAHAFAQWASHYRRRCERDRHIDAARLPDVVAGLLGETAVPKPRCLVAYAFDILTPQMRALFAACAAAGVEMRNCGSTRRAATALRWPFASAREELDGAARWARARLEQSGQAGVRIGIVVPDLELRRKAVVRVFTNTLSPAHNLPAQERKPLPFNVSIGTPLTDCPLVHATLALIELAGGNAEFAQVSRLLRSPFIEGAQAEAMPRARLDAQLRRSVPPRLSLPRLLSAISAISDAGVAAPVLAEKLKALFAYARSHLAGRKSARDWAGHFSGLLAAAGLARGRTLDSIEFQTHTKWNEVLSEFAGLSRVLPVLGFGEALMRLRRLCAETLFQPESSAAPIQVLGILESAGMEFDFLWVSGLTDDAWPLAARPNPFIAPALQKKAGIPEASAETALTLDRHITAHWLGAAGEVVFSHAQREADRELAPSSLIVALPEGALALPEYPRYRDLMFATRLLEPAPDGQAPALSQRRVSGGAAVLADQAACPFRAFAHHRLGAKPLETPVAGLDARARGNLLHVLMKGIWDELQGKAALDAATPDELAAVIERAAAAAVARAQRDNDMQPRFAELERARLEKLAREWLEVERGRAGFRVAATEDKRALTAGGIELSGRIDRLDRLDSLGDGGGGHVLIDYKSGRATPKSWESARPDDPQLPLYAVNASEPVAAVTFAKLKTGGMRLMGYSRDKDALPKVKQYHDWNALLAGWRRELDALGTAFAAGDARVDPKALAKTCRYCDLQPLCRVHEKLSALALEDGAGAAGDGNDEAGEAEA